MRDRRLIKAEGGEGGEGGDLELALGLEYVTFMMALSAAVYFFYSLVTRRSCSQTSSDLFPYIPDTRGAAVS